MKSAIELIVAQAALVRATGKNVPSPCLSVCRMSGAQLCEGCFRTLDEIAAWSRMGDDEKRAVWAQIEARAGAAT